MTETQMSKDEFFRQFIVKLCSSLDIPKALYQCFLFIKESIPIDIMDLTILIDKPPQLQCLIGVNSDGKIFYIPPINLPAELWSYMQNHLKQNDIRLIYAPENRKYAEMLAKLDESVLENLDVSIPLVYKNEPIGFLALRVKEKLTQDQIGLLTAIQQPLAYALAASLKYEDKEKLQTQSFSADLIFNRIKALKNTDTDIALAKKLDSPRSVIYNSRVRNSVPYDKIIVFCQREGIPMDFIFMHNPFILTEKNNDGLYKAVLSCGMKYLDATGVEDLMKLPHGSLDTYIEKCASNASIIPPVEKLSMESLKSFYDALQSQQIYGGSASDTCTNINIPVASGYILKNGQVDTTGTFLHFCKEWIKTLSSSSNIFAYSIVDDSMTPALVKGDIVLIDSNEKIPKMNGLYAVSLGDNLFIRRLTFSKDGCLTMTCDNQVYPADTISSNNVLGKVVWYARNL